MSRWNTTQPDHAAFAGSQNGAGLTKREWYAGVAMLGILANPELTECGPAEVRRIALDHADALIDGLNGKGE